MDPKNLKELGRQSAEILDYSTDATEAIYSFFGLDTDVSSLPDTFTSFGDKIKNNDSFLDRDVVYPNGRFKFIHAAKRPNK